ncbi:MAG: hypothetical protein AAF192_19015, partial [Pseudomonadota bacterium]
PALSEMMRPALSALVATVYALGMVRLDLGAALARLRRPRPAAALAGEAAALLILPTLAAWAVAEALGAGPDWTAAAVWTFAAPPIASAAGLCFLMGWDAARALRVTVAASLLMPALGPALGAALLGAETPLDPWTLAGRTAAMIGAGAAGALAMQRWLGRARIERNGRAFDGLTAIVMVLFLFPIFDGVPALIQARPGLAAGFLALSCALIFAPHALRPLLPGDRPAQGAAALLWGTRSVGIWAAALPPDPVLLLYFALYQLPMFAQPLILGALTRR